MKKLISLVNIKGKTKKQITAELKEIFIKIKKSSILPKNRNPQA